MQVGVVALDPKDQLALIRLAGHDRQAAALELGERPFLRVEPQAGFSGLVVRTVAGEAVVREDRPDIAREIDRAWLGVAGGSNGITFAAGRLHAPQGSRKPTRFADETPCLPPCTGWIQPSLSDRRDWSGRHIRKLGPMSRNLSMISV